MNRISVFLILCSLVPLFGQITWTEHNITSDFDGAIWAHAVDMDNDTDIDVLGAAWEADAIAWYENDGNENFTEHEIASSFDGACCVFGIDLDGDDDGDVIATAYFDNTVAWWENNAGVFTGFCGLPMASSCNSGVVGKHNAPGASSCLSGAMGSGNCF